HVNNPLLGEREERVQPFATYVGNDPGKLTGNPRFVRIDRKDKKEDSFILSPSAIRQIEPYEKVAKRAVEAFLGIGTGRVPSDTKLIAAEQALTFVSKYHDSAREEGKRKGNDWKPVRAELRGEVLKVVVLRLRMVVEDNDLDAALKFAGDAARR